jgi:hypothetical protein
MNDKRRRRNWTRAGLNPPPTITQTRTLASLNRSLGTTWALPATEKDTRFLIDGLISEERRRKRARRL